ncbi:MAG: rhodanese-like domain-containing protein [Cryomorphaceae bacterium]|nr:rhodanese-like domain-containing protein [Cryomorphaceae bacterium]
MRSAILSVFLLVACQGGRDLDGPVQLVSEERFAELLRAFPGALIIDVRSPEAHGRGSISRSVNFDFADENFQNKLRQLSSQQVYLLYSDDAKTSKSLVSIMEGLYFREVYILKKEIDNTKIPLTK